MGKREAFAAVAIPLLVAAILWLPAIAFLGLLSIAVALAADELLAMARGAGIPVGRWIPLLMLIAVLAGSWYWGPTGSAVMAITAVIVLPTAQLGHPRAPEGGFAASAATVFTVLYAGLCGACLGWLRILPDSDLGIRLLFFFLACIWVGDSGAYYVGSHFGRHKMTPRISPNKTWEGLAGGAATTFAAAAVSKLVFGLPWSWGHILALAAILAVAAPLGDLVESQFKRDTKVKDSSNLIPGHGGFLDRTDSLLYAAPPVLGYLVAAGLIG
jgi:phosphatidate cytidylyltransferase